MNPFSKPGHFYRGNLHTHSTRSDGVLEPADVVRAYRDEGYDFVAITDHFLERFGYAVTDSSNLRSADFTTLLGAELHGPELEIGGLWHLVAVGLPADFGAVGPEETGPSIAARAAATGAFVGAAHPSWYGMTLGDMESVLGVVDAIEVYNETCAQLNDRGDSWVLADALLAQGHRLNAYAADDAHFNRADAFGAWVQVRAESLDPEALLAALKAGDFYSSQGPVIDNLEFDGEALHIECSPSRSVFVAGVGASSQRHFGGAFTRATLKVPAGHDGYLRVTLVDAACRRAWTNPIWL